MSYFTLPSALTAMPSMSKQTNTVSPGRTLFSVRLGPSRPCVPRTLDSLRSVGGSAASARAARTARVDAIKGLLLKWRWTGMEKEVTLYEHGRVFQHSTGGALTEPRTE